MDLKIVVLVLALFFGSAAAFCPSCDNCVANVCQKCSANYYLNSGSCVACTACATGEYRVSGCLQNATVDAVCTACPVSCPSGQYYDAATCGATAHPTSDGCQRCDDCITSDGPRWKAWGVCGGPSPYSYHPEQLCLAPGVALCEVCSAYITDWAWTQIGANDSFCDNTKDDSWLYLSGQTESDLITCCHNAQDLETNGDCDFPMVPDEVQVAAHKSCLYNSVMTCLGIYTPPPTGSGWPLPTTPPDEPL